MVLVCVSIAYSQEKAHSDLVQGSLAELNDLRHVKLIVMRNSVIDIRDMKKSLIDEAYQAQSTGRRHIYSFNTLARKLNEYIRKYGSISAVEQISEADFIVLFNLLEYRRFLNGAYPYGELFVILQDKTDAQRPARIIWQAKKVMWAEDAMKELIKELKSARGER